MNTRPVPVLTGPPRLIDPTVDGRSSFIVSLRSPSGTRHAIAPLSGLTATSSPHGGATHGRPDGDMKNSRDIANGAPDCSVVSRPGKALRASLKLARGDEPDDGREAIDRRDQQARDRVPCRAAPVQPADVARHDQRAARGSAA